MKYLSYLLLLVSFFPVSYAQTGITQNKNNTVFKSAGNAEVYQNANDNCMTSTTVLLGKFLCTGNAEPYTRQKTDNILFDKNFNKLDSITFDTYIPAGANFGIKFNTHKRSLSIITPNYIINSSKNAIKKSPAWIKTRLELTLSKLDSARQEVFAGLINNAKDPYIDEIAFSIAYESPEFLSSQYCYPQLFVENAKLIYAHDSDLAYVDIVDHGNSQTDENYYSTVKYWKIDKDSNRVQIEVPKDIYYMYLVHPKTTDEIETYVDPFVPETYDNKDHHFNVAAPPTGRFWRDFLYTYTEKIPNDTTGKYFPILRDSISKCTVLWDEKNHERGAIKEITKWVNDVMDFNSGNERPHEPNRIYALHLGRCGEHEDITNAASRSCLVPCRGIEALSSDHVWNEFWDESWWQWEPVNNSMKEPLVYEKGWGKKFGSLIARRSDGVELQATDTYSENPCKITLYAADNNNQPIDGAIFMLAVNGTLDSTSIFIDRYSYADNEGKCEFIVSSADAANKTYYAKVYTPLGNMPVADNQVAKLLDNPAKNGDYAYKLRVGGTKSVKLPLNGTMPSEPSEDFHLLINAKIENAAINWGILFNDISGTKVINDITGGNFNFYLSDEQNYNSGTKNADYSVFDSRTNTSSVQLDYKLSDDGNNYFAWMKNINCISNYIRVSGSFVLYASPSVDVAEKNVEQTDFTAYPNPFDKSVKLSFELQQPSQVKLYIMNLNGRIVKNICSGLLESGQQSFEWTGKDNNDNYLGDGIYICSLTIDDKTLMTKIAIVR